LLCVRHTLLFPFSLVQLIHLAGFMMVFCLLAKATLG